MVFKLAEVGMAGGGGKEGLEGLEERKETQSYPVVGLFPGCSHVAADGLCPEAWLSESSCSQVLVLTAGVTAPLCTSGMPGINGLHCGRMHELLRPGMRPMLAWTGVGRLTARSERLYLQINGETRYYSSILFQLP